MSDLRLECSPPKQQRGHWTTTAKLYAGEAIVFADTIRLDDPAERAAFAAQVRQRGNGSAPDPAAVEQKLLELLDAATQDDADDGGDHKSQATRLIELALGSVELFHDRLHEAYARLRIDDHVETWPVRSRAFKRWLAGVFYSQYNEAATSSALADALLTIENEACFRGERREVYVRVAPDGLGGIYLDLGDSAWRAVHLAPVGWQIVQDVPVCFRRSAGTAAFPEPERGGTLDALRPFANVEDDDDFALLLAWLRMALSDRGPYPVLALKGEQGSAKSTLARVLRRLVDPASPELRSDPRELRDVAIAARHSWLVAFDNVSHLQPWLSDALCRLATGDGWATRELYTDVDETLFEAKRPIILNGISEYITRGDLLDRAIQLSLPAIPDARRRPEADFWRAFDRVYPRIFGALLDSVCAGLRALPTVRLHRLPRMADFAYFAVACERGAGEPERFLAAYDHARTESQSAAIEASLLGLAIERSIVPVLDAGPWQGTASELLDQLNDLTDDKTKRSPAWPKTPRALSGELRRLAPAFRARGIEIVFGERAGKDRARLITIFRRVPPDEPPNEPSSPEELPAEPSACVRHENALENQGKMADGRADDNRPLASAGAIPSAACDDPADGRSGWRTVADDSLSDNRPPISLGISRENDGRTVADGLAPTFSGEQVCLLTTPAAVEAALPDLLAAPVLGLDSETTGLDPRRSRLRLVQLATPARVYVLDAFQTDVRQLAPVFAGARGPILIGHNLKFDLAFLAAAGLPVPDGTRLFDMMLAAQLLGAGTDDGRLDRCSLAAVAERCLGERLDKAHQTSDWSGPLSAEQIRYAARDAAVLLPLRERLATEITAAGLDWVARLEMRALPAIVWLERTGAPFDAAAWQRLSDAAVRRQIEIEAELTSLAGTENLLGDSAVLWSSPAQVLKVLRARGHDMANTDEATLVALAAADPLARLLLDYREASRRAGAYGIEFLRHVADDGRIHADYIQIGAATGRMACSNPNLQQVPRDPAYRACFRPRPGRVLVKADYSQIELRIAAEIAGDKRMQGAFNRGEDLHALTARLVLGKQDVSKADRQAAKALNFGLLYGMGAETFRQHAATEYGVQLTPEEAASLRARWLKAYAGIRAWHRSQPDGPTETRTLAGRRRLGVERYTEKLNTPVQGTGADGLKAALALLWETRDRCPSARPVLAVHDEIVVECDAEDADRTSAWLVECMRRGMSSFLRKVPVEVEATIARDWSGAHA